MRIVDSKICTFSNWETRFNTIVRGIGKQIRGNQDIACHDDTVSVRVLVEIDKKEF